MFGKTLKIDMKYTRKHGVLRILVGCLNWSKIPKRFPLFIKDGFYNLSFDIEGEVRPEVEDLETDDQKKDDNDGDDDLGEDFKEVLEKDGQLANAASAAGSAAPQGNPAGGGGTAPPSQSVAITGVVFSPTLRREIQKAKEVLASIGGSQFTNECEVQKVMTTNEEDGQRALDADVVSGVLSVQARVSSPARQVVSPVSADTAEGSEMDFAGMAPVEDFCVSSPVRREVGLVGIGTPDVVDEGLSPTSPGAYGGDGSSVGGTASSVSSPPRAADAAKATLLSAQRAKVVSYGGIPDPLTSALRSSGRIRAQGNADDTQMARAMALAQRRDCFPGKNLNPTFSLLSLPDEHIVEHASRLGVSLGVSTMATKNSVSLIKEIEAARQLHIVEKNLNMNADENGDPTSLVLSRASCLSEDMEDEETLGVEADQLDLLPQPVVSKRKRNKKVLGTSQRRCSARLKKQTNKS